MKTIVTTGDKGIVDVAKDVAKSISAHYIPRENKSLDRLRLEYNADQILVVTKKQMQLIMPTGVYFFHIGMAKLRIKSILDGKYDHMALAMALSPGDWILDCTLGLGTDATVASFLTGSTGGVVGIEESAVVAELVRRGLRCYEGTDEEMTKAMHRIEVVTGDYLLHLRKLPAKSFDIVYFDPMFRRPVKESSGIASLRLLANHAPVSCEAITEAIRIARKRVVLKEAANSTEFSRLGFHRFSGGKYSSVMYGYIEAQEGE